MRTGPSLTHLVVRVDLHLVLAALGLLMPQVLLNDAPGSSRTGVSVAGVHRSTVATRVRGRQGRGRRAPEHERRRRRLDTEQTVADDFLARCMAGDVHLRSRGHGTAHGQWKRMRKLATRESSNDDDGCRAPRSPFLPASATPRSSRGGLPAPRGRPSAQSPARWS
jgi:hypothetical protein